MKKVDRADITRWLDQLAGHDAQVNEALFQTLYRELHQIARSHMRNEGAGHTLSPTSLLHEAYLRVSDGDSRRWNSRTHFLAVASQMMRHILVDYARAKRADKRDGGARVTLTLQAFDAAAQDLDVVRVHDALLAFEALDARAAKVVELKFFGGMEIDEIAGALDLSPATVKREWATARAWLQRELAQ